MSTDSKTVGERIAEVDVVLLELRRRGMDPVTVLRKAIEEHDCQLESEAENWK